jgi:hypothetical protein
MWESEGVIISGKRNNGRERERLLFIKLIKWSIKPFCKRKHTNQMTTETPKQLLCTVQAILCINLLPICNQIFHTMSSKQDCMHSKTACRGDLFMSLIHLIF